jgi:FixJ family two-component response regulator
MKTMKQLFDKIIFVVDDDPIWTTILTHVLNDLGYTNVITYSSGTDCINNLYQSPALIFLDYQMRDMDGIQVLQKIKAYNSETAVIFCTDNKELSIAVTAMKNGSHDYLVKSNITNASMTSVIKKMTEAVVVTEKVF